MASCPSRSTDLSAAAQWVVYTIRHVIRDEELADELALKHARALLLQPLTGFTQEQEYQGLVEALDSSVVLSTWRDDPRFERPIPEAEFRAHLIRVVDRLDAMRPWPVPLFRGDSPERWREYEHPRLVGVIRLRVPNVQDRIHIPMTPMTTDGVQRRVAVLVLRSGREVVLVGHWWPDATDVVAVLTRDPSASAEELMAELTSGDHFEPGEYETLSGEG